MVGSHGVIKLAIHDFDERLAWSLRSGDEPFWEAVYFKAFPNMVSWNLCNDIRHQRMGIDRVLSLSNGRKLYIDEKKRSRVYNDILLEYISVDTTGAPGWMEKDLAIDYLAYAFMPIRRCYLFPWEMLRRAWLHFRDTWKAEYKSVPGYNEGYTTWSVAVPIGVLTKAVSVAAIIDVGAELCNSCQIPIREEVYGV